ncbi:hypothetical protein B0H13DRAFT_1929859 [Mycena leptocephala]|nr:hypothetical protein B0H13DRAFT_1929859 [Mycena leptocephala]
MQIAPVLLQMALLLFSAALSIYLWTIHLSLAIIVLCFTSVGFISYTTLFISAAVDPDSPFQIPLAPLIRQFTLWLIHHKATVWIIEHLSTAISFWTSGSPSLPLFIKSACGRKEDIKQDSPATIFATPFPDSSQEVPAVLWVLETSTDPHMTDVVAEMAVTMQWPRNMDITPQLHRFYDAFLSCFKHRILMQGPVILYKIREGIATQAIHLGKAYCVLRWILKEKESSAGQHRFQWSGSDIRDPELKNVVRILEGRPLVIKKWALQAIPLIPHWHPNLGTHRKALQLFLRKFDDEILPTLDPSSFADYLFCLGSFLSPIKTNDMVWMDKSEVQLELLKFLFDSLREQLKKQLSVDTTIKIMDLTGQFAKDGLNVWNHANKYQDRQIIVNDFCSSLPQLDNWAGIVLSTVHLAEQYNYKEKKPCGGDYSWVYKALESVKHSPEIYKWDSSKTLLGVEGLFKALLHYDAPPSKDHVNLLLHGLSMTGDISSTAASLLLREIMEEWFKDDELRPILQENSMWASLVQACSKNPATLDTERVLEIGNILADTPSWHAYIHNELPSWIAIFFPTVPKVIPKWSLSKKYISVLDRVGKPNPGGYEFIQDPEMREKVLGLTFVTLSKLWEDFGVAASSPDSYISMLRCTNRAVLRNKYGDKKMMSDIFFTAFSIPLQNSLIRASASIKNVARENASPALGEVLETLEEIIGKMPKAKPKIGELGNEYHYWKGLREELEIKINKLEDTQHMSFNSLDD